MKRKVFLTSLLLRSMALLCLLLPCVSVIGQSKKVQKAPAKQERRKDTTSHIIIKHANSLEFDKHFGNGAQRLIGDVQLKDSDINMTCDSAYVYSDNSLRAFSNVHLSRPDTMDLYGDSVHYFGDVKKALIFGKIRFIRQALTLTTHHMLYIVDSSRVNYWDGGTLVDSATTLVSKKGTYFMHDRLAAFKDSVVLTNPSYHITCDTMSYEPDAKIAHFSGPTYITSKTTHMYCIAGYYNSATGISEFWKHATITGKKGEKLSGEHIYYDKNKDYGEVHNDAAMSDSVNNILIKGNYALYKGMDKTIMVTQHAEMDQQYEKDTLHLHGDTLFGYNISMGDSTTGPKEPKLLLAYHHVKFYKKDMQGKCDSLVYDEKDSAMRMYYKPILWADQNQLTADTMKLFFKDKKMNTLDMRSNSFIISRDTLASKEDSLQFNQIKGRNMKGFFKNNKIYKVKVMGNAQTIYYVYSDNNTTVVGANRADCSNMLIFIDSNKIKSITFLQKPDATLFPMKDVKQPDFLLGNFKWRIDERPMRKEDIFN